MDTLLSMQVFRQIVESGTFTAAADKLEMSVAMVSKHVRYLEARVGVRLLNRTSRHVSLSPAGQLYYDRCCEVLNTVDETEGEIRTALKQPTGTLRISAPTFFGNKAFASTLAAYRRLYPGVKLDVVLSDALADLVADGLDLALRISTGFDPSVPARELCPIEFGIVASRAYLEKHGRPASVADLMHHQIVAYAYEPPDAMGFPVAPAGCRSNNTTLMARLVAEGAGIAIMPRMAILDDLHSEARLEFILPDVKLPRPSLYAVTHERRRLSARITTFIDFLAERLNPVRKGEEALALSSSLAG